MVEYLYVDDAAKTREMRDRLENSRRICIDLEADSYHHYGEKISLLQVGDGKNIFVIDPFEVDLACMVPFLEDASVEKVFHDVDYDGRMLLTALGVKPVPIFDTMIAARILGKERVGLADLLDEYFRVTLDKGLRKADWSQRPLSEEMLKYAALDVAYLLDLRDRMAQDIEALGRTAWAREEFTRLIANLEPMPERKPDLKRVKGARDLGPRQLAVLLKLLEWREKKARAMDLPTFKVVGTERLLKIAQHRPRGRRELEATQALTPRQAARFGADILAAVREGMKMPGNSLPGFEPLARHKRDLAAERLLRKLKEARDEKAAEVRLDPGFLLPNATLKAVARLHPRDLTAIKESGLLKDWQLEVIGEALAACLPHD